MRKDELAAISGPNEFAEFYNRLKQIKEFHRKHPNEVGTLAPTVLFKQTNCKPLNDLSQNCLVFLADFHSNVCRV